MKGSFSTAVEVMTSIIDLDKCVDKQVRVKFQGGREGAWQSTE